ncbi:Hypothetical protein ZAZAV_497 [Cedratvirus Zaza IHUMI]|uniref:Uncharacterized protein n=1 Tax=Cedratvirus Zaza IHUMI TaxID=2126979 RepID=A0A2R8FFR4_9VIRU|nr:Hypothetical protein ZAZAV_497 [Cedratvirus Zaza IHUMI]
MSRVLSSPPLSESLQDDVLHVTWPHQGVKKENLYIEISDTTIYIGNMQREILRIFMVSSSHDCTTLRAFYKEDHVLFTIKPRKGPLTRRVLIE